MNRWFIALLIIPFVKPATELTGKYDVIFDILTLISCFVIISLYILKFKKISKIILAISIMQFIFWISTIINGGMIWWATVQAISIISICALLEMTIKLNLKEALIGFSIPMVIMATATIITMFLAYPKGLYQITQDEYYYVTSNYLWGFDNSSIFKFIPTLIILILCTYKTNNNYKIFGLIFLLFATNAFIFTESLAAAGACLIILGIYIFLLIKKKSIRILNFKNIMTVITVIIVIILGINRNSMILKDMVMGTAKEGSLYFRLNIWNRTIEQIEKSPIIGYGLQETEVTTSKLILDHPHNIFLDILYRGGIAGIVTFWGMVILIIKNSNNKENITIIDNIINAGILALMAVSQMDYYNEQCLLFLLFVLAYYSKDISNEMNGRLLNDGVKKDEK